MMLRYLYRYLVAAAGFGNRYLPNHSQPKCGISQTAHIISRKIKDESNKTEALEVGYY